MLGYDYFILHIQHLYICYRCPTFSRLTVSAPANALSFTAFSKLQLRERESCIAYLLFLLLC
jgi:hypothetical protein